MTPSPVFVKFFKHAFTLNISVSSVRINVTDVSLLLITNYTRVVIPHAGVLVAKAQHERHLVGDTVQLSAAVGNKVGILSYVRIGIDDLGGGVHAGNICEFGCCCH